ncbi:hypothetical protein SD81_018620 [Tolypothrix campylonemoides VB511288]|nr:hypothetical protein SD81_018620 [Tolypothrix campylonemoides VB511288]
MVGNSRVDSIFEEFSKQLDIAKIAINRLNLLSVGIFLFLPLFNLLHLSPCYQWMRIIDGLRALRARVVAVHTRHLAFPLLWRVSKIFPQMRTLTFWSTVVAFLGIATGNLAYMHYIANFHKSSVRAWLKENSPIPIFFAKEKFFPNHVKSLILDSKLKQRLVK